MGKDDGIANDAESNEESDASVTSDSIVEKGSVKPNEKGRQTKTEYLKSVPRRDTKSRQVNFEETTAAGRTANTSLTGDTSTTPSSSFSPSAASRYQVDPHYIRKREYHKWEREELIPALAWRSYHIRSYNWCEDWFQFFANSHPFFGICCHHHKHPVRWPMRVVILVGSFVFGLLVTNLIWFYVVYNEGNQAVVSITLSQNITALKESLLSKNNTGLKDSSDLDGESEGGDNRGTTIEVTEGMILLWTVGGMMHALYDNTIWYFAACSCFYSSSRSTADLARCRRFGMVFVVCSLIVVGVISSYLVVLRASLMDPKEEENAGLRDWRWAGLNDDQIHPLTGYNDKSSFQFLLSYGVEVLLALLVWYPLVGTLLFSGILGCGRLPVLGGRPYEVRQERIRLEREERWRRKKACRSDARSTASTLSGDLSEHRSSTALESALAIYRPRNGEGYEEGYEIEALGDEEQPSTCEPFSRTQRIRPGR